MAKRKWNASNPLFRWMKRRKSKSTPTRATGTTMARRKRRFFARRVGRRSRGSSTGSLMSTATGVVIPAMAYGALRSKLAEWASPITSKIPLGSYADEALFGFAGYMLAKKTSGMLRQAGMAALTVESASVGNQLAGGFMSQSSSAGAISASNPSFNGWV